MPPIKRLVSALLTIMLVVIGYEIIFALDFHYAEITRTTLGVIGLITIIGIAFRHGLHAALMSALLIIAYLFYALAGPGRNVQSLETLARSSWIIVLIYLVPAAIIGYLRDLADQLFYKERQARLQAEYERKQLTTILEQLPVGVAIAEAPSGKIAFSNQHLEEILGHSVSRAESLQHYPTNVLVDENRQPLPPEAWPFHRVIKQHEVIYNEEFRYLQNNQNMLTLRVKGVPIYNSQKEVTSAVVIVDDVSEDKLADQRKDDFVSMVSHELKTPITSLKMYTQLAIKQQAQDQSYDPSTTLKKIDGQADKLHRIINNMIDLTRAQLDKENYQMERVDIGSIVKEVVKDMNMAHPNRRISSTLLHKNYVMADRDRIAQVLSNLLSNAIKYSPESTEIIIKAKPDTTHLIVSVQDFGVGISSRDQQQIFNRFYQAKQKDGKVYQGLGIGLYFCAEVVKHHQGKIWVESQKGNGSTFAFTLPLAP
jgi:two-component system, OmpR family, phosphate regulon sensor histidine kinase PhoR